MHQVPGGDRSRWRRHGREAPGLYGLPGPAVEVLALLRGLAALELGGGGERGLTVEDLAQEACLRLLRGVAPAGGWVGRGLDSWAGWLRLLVRNLARDHLARQVRRREASPGRWGLHHGAGSARADSGFERVDEALDPPLASLPAGLRSVAMLVMVGLPVREAARALDLPEAELQRRALLAAWILAEGAPPALDAPGAIPRHARPRGAIVRAVLRRRRAGWSWPQLAAVLGCAPEELRRRAERYFAQDPG